MEFQFTQKQFDLPDQVAVVTGCAGVLYTSLCRTLANTVVKIAVLDINREASDQLALEINKSGGNAIAITCDISEKESIKFATQQNISSFRRLDILINGAGGNNPLWCRYSNQCCL